jgi:hypothetical protein
MSAPTFSLITVGIYLVVSINGVSMPTRILDIKGNSCTSEMPLPQSKTHRLFLLRIKMQ